MKRFALAAAGAALIGSALLLPVPTDAQNSPPGVPGYLNPRTGLFTARPVLLPAAAGLQKSGTIIVTITATLGSNIPSIAPVACVVDVSTSDSEFTNSAFASGVLVRLGKGGTCRISVPFIFQVASAATTMNVFVSITASTPTLPPLTYDASTSASFPVPSGTKSLAFVLAM